MKISYIPIYLIKRGLKSIWVSEAHMSPIDEPYTLPWEYEYPRNDCNGGGGYGAVIKGERHESSDYERGYKQGYEARKNDESKSARMIVDYDADLLKATYEEGLNDAWETARKIRLYPSDGGISIEDLSKIFGNQTHYDILRDYSAQEAIEKIKAWEDKEDEKC